MDKRRVTTIILMVLCLGIFFYSSMNKRGERKEHEDLPKAEYSEGDFRDQGELWDYMHAHEFICSENGNTLVLTVKNFTFYINGTKYSDKLEMSDFQYKAAGFSGYDMQGRRFNMALMKEGKSCSLIEVTGGANQRVYVAN